MLTNDESGGQGGAVTPNPIPSPALRAAPARELSYYHDGDSENGDDNGGTGSGPGEVITSYTTTTTGGGGDDGDVPVINVSSGRVFMESWLEKEPQWRPGWDRRFVTLDGLRMAYRVEEEAAEKGSATVSMLDTNTEKSELVFRVWLVEGGRWRFRVGDTATYARWLEALHTALETTSVGSGAGNGAVAPIPPQRQVSATSPVQNAVLGIAESPGSSPGLVSGRSSPASCNTIDAAKMRGDSPAPLPWAPAQLSARVEKQGAWTGRWKPRVLELTDGNQLAYRSSETGGVKQRYTVTAVDPAVRTRELTTSANSALAAVVGRLLLFTTTVRERFWVRFESAHDCQYWYRTLAATLRRLSSWQWMPLLEESAPSGPSARLLPGRIVRAASPSATVLLDDLGNHDYVALRTQYHCAAVVPLTSSGGSGGGVGQCILAYGGIVARASAARPDPFPLSQWPGEADVEGEGEGHAALMPVPLPPILSRDTASRYPYNHSVVRAAVTDEAAALRLFGSHSVQAPLAVRAYEERAHVRVRPPSLYGATLTAVLRTSTGQRLNRVSVTAVQAVMVGGLDAAGGLPSSEVWSLLLSPPAHFLADGTNTVPAPDFSPSWRRVVFPLAVLPQLVFHSVTDVSAAVATPPLSPVAARDSAAAVVAKGDATPPSSRGGEAATVTLLITGGVDGERRPRKECYLLQWPCDESPAPREQQQQQPVVSPTIVPLGDLPHPRAFHGSATLRDGTAVIVGGRSSCGSGGIAGDGLTPILTLPPSAITASIQVAAAAGGAAPAAAASQWLPVAWDTGQWALPPMPDAAVAITEARDRVVVLSQLPGPRPLVKLFILSFDAVLPDDESDDGSGSGSGTVGGHPRHTMRVRWTEIALRVGAVPRAVAGASIHICNGYIYVLGATASDDGGGGGGGGGDTGTAPSATGAIASAAAAGGSSGRKAEDGAEGETIAGPLRVLMAVP